MKFYIDVPVERRCEHNTLGDQLVVMGHQITHDWTLYEDDTPEFKAVHDIAGVAEADVLIALLPGGRSFHVEIGAALSRGVQVLLVGDQCDADGKRCVFYYHPMVLSFLDTAAVLEFCRGINES